MKWARPEHFECNVIVNMYVEKTENFKSNFNEDVNVYKLNNIQH